MLRSLFILMLVGLMAAVGFYYENQAGESQAKLEAGADNILVAATAVRNVSEPEQASDIDCESLDSESLNPESLDCIEKPAVSQQTADMHLSGMDEDTIKPFQH
jgi:hypothetical protein